MPWKLGGNLEPVKIICELDWKDCIFAITNYVWGELVTDVIDYLTNDGIIWQVLFIVLICTIPLHSFYCKSKIVNETALQKQCMVKINSRVQDLELKCNVLTYKLQYGIWPLPYKIQYKDLKNRSKNLKITGSHEKFSWIKEILLSPTNETKYHSCLGLDSYKMRQWKKLFDLDRNEISNQLKQSSRIFRWNVNNSNTRELEKRYWNNTQHKQRVENENSHKFLSFNNKRKIKSLEYENSKSEPYLSKGENSDEKQDIAIPPSSLVSSYQSASTEESEKEIASCLLDDQLERNDRNLCNDNSNTKSRADDLLDVLTPFRKPYTSDPLGKNLLNVSSSSTDSTIELNGCSIAPTTIEPQSFEKNQFSPCPIVEENDFLLESESKSNKFSNNNSMKKETNEPAMTSCILPTYRSEEESSGETSDDSVNRALISEAGLDCFYSVQDFKNERNDFSELTKSYNQDEVVGNILLENSSDKFGNNLKEIEKKRDCSDAREKTKRIDEIVREGVNDFLNYTKLFLKKSNNEIFNARMALRCMDTENSLNLPAMENERSNSISPNDVDNNNFVPCFDLGLNRQRGFHSLTKDTFLNVETNSPSDNCEAAVNAKMREKWANSNNIDLIKNEILCSPATMVNPMLKRGNVANEVTTSSKKSKFVKKYYEEEQDTGIGILKNYVVDDSKQCEIEIVYKENNKNKTNPLISVLETALSKMNENFEELRCQANVVGECTNEILNDDENKSILSLNTVDNNIEKLDLCLINPKTGEDFTSPNRKNTSVNKNENLENKVENLERNKTEYRENISNKDTLKILTELKSDPDIDYNSTTSTCYADAYSHESIKQSKTSLICEPSISKTLKSKSINNKISKSNKNNLILPKESKHTQSLSKNISVSNLKTTKSVKVVNETNLIGTGKKTRKNWKNIKRDTSVDSAWHSARPRLGLMQKKSKSDLDVHKQANALRTLKASTDKSKSDEKIDKEGISSIESNKSRLSSSRLSLKSSIPILKTRLDVNRKIEHNLRSKSPKRGPLTIVATPQDDPRARSIIKRVEGQSTNNETNLTSILTLEERIISSILAKNFHRETPAADLGKNVSLTREKTFDSSNLIDVDKSITRTIIDSNDERSDFGELLEQEIFSVSSDEISLTPEASSSGNYTETLYSKINVSPVEVLPIESLKKIWLALVNRKEIDIMAKPSVADISTSISDFQDISILFRNLQNCHSSDLPKELTDKECAILLETLNQESNLLHLQQIQNLRNKLFFRNSKN